MVLLEHPVDVQSSDYKSAGSHQSEVNKYLLVEDQNSYMTIYTVPAGKTLFISNIVAANGALVDYFFATGAAASEVDFIHIICAASETVIVPLNVPIKISAGTRLSVKNTGANDGGFSFSGWIE